MPQVDVEKFKTVYVITTSVNPADDNPTPFPF